MELEPEFWEWMREGTRRERYDKQVRLLKFIRENRRMFTVTDEYLEEWEGNVEDLRRNNEQAFLAELNLRALTYEKEQADRELDKTLLTEENLPIIPLFGKRKKDSH